MKITQALGMIETYGRLGDIEALDAALKAANVSLIGMVKVGSGINTVLFEGEVAAVKASVDAGAAAAERVAKVLSTHVIPRPDPSVREMLKEHDALPWNGGGGDDNGPDEPAVKEEEKPEVKPEVKEEIKAEEKTEEKPAEVAEPEAEAVAEAKAETAAPDSLESLQSLTVSKLRAVARETEGFPLSKSEIKFAKKGDLLDAFKTLLK